MIKDQCDKCKDRNGCIENKVFNSISCPNYVRGINLEKHVNMSEGTTEQAISKPVVSPISTPEVATPTSEETTSIVITSEYLKQTTDIHGWLSFFLFSTVVGGLVSGIYPIATYNPAEYSGNTTLALSDIVFGLMLCGVAFFTFYAFTQRKSNAVFLGKTYVVAILVSNLLLLIVGNYNTSGFGSFPQIIRGLVWGIIWFSYLCMSNQVQKVIPKAFRKLKSIDYYILVVLIVVPLLFLALGIQEINNSHEKETAVFLKEVVLGENEYTDGKVVFAKPQSFTCEDSVVNGLKIFNLENKEIGSVTLCSDNDNDQSVQNINSYWENWEDKNASKYKSEIIVNEKRTVNEHTYYYRVKRYEIDRSDVYWRFIMLFDDASSKVCVMSCYDDGIDNYIDEILQSIRFH